MKKILTIAALTAFGVASYAQGLVNLNYTGSTFLISTNTAGGVSGKVNGAGAYYFELLDSTSTSLASSANQIYGNAQNFALWTDSTLLGQNGIGLNAGKLTGASSGAAANWAPAQSAAAFGAPDSYILVGWSANYGTTWSQVASLIQSGSLASGGYFGVSAIGVNVAGGNGAGAVNIWGNQTGTQGYGLNSGFLLNQVVPAPEPTTIALGAIGGASLLFLRRRKQA